MSSYISTKQYDTVVSARNDYTHYRSVFHGHTPSFKYLAEKYPDFKAVLTSTSSWSSSATTLLSSSTPSVPVTGTPPSPSSSSSSTSVVRYSLDWTNSSHVLLYTQIILQEYIGLRYWTCPSDRLCPTVTSRLNYILWIEDLCVSFYAPFTMMMMMMNSYSNGTDSLSSLDTTVMNTTTKNGGNSKCITTSSSSSIISNGIPLRSMNIYGIDIGTGASCIYPLLGCSPRKQNGGSLFHMLGTDIDPLNMQYALTNITKNHLSSRISLLLTSQTSPSTTTSVVPSTSDTSLLLYPIKYYQSFINQSHNGTEFVSSAQHISRQSSATDSNSSFIPNNAIDPQLYHQAFTLLRNYCIHIRDLTQHYPIIDFTMCNPPFYSSWQEAQESMQNAIHRTACTGSAVEMSYPGGEVAFIQRMITEIVEYETSSSEAPSVLLPRKYEVRWYTSMVGKYSSLDPLLNLLRSYQVPTVRITELYQGKTVRWCIGWSWYASSAYLCTGWRFPFAETVDDQGSGSDKRVVPVVSLDEGEEERTEPIENTSEEQSSKVGTNHCNPYHPQTKRARTDKNETAYPRGSTPFLSSSSTSVLYHQKADTKHLVRIFHIGVTKASFVLSVPHTLYSPSTYLFVPDQSSSYRIIPSLRDQQYIQENLRYTEDLSPDRGTQRNSSSMILPTNNDSPTTVCNYPSKHSSFVLVPDMAELYVRIEEALPVGEILHVENTHLVMVPTKNNRPMITFVPYTINNNADYTNDNTKNEKETKKNTSYRILGSWITYCIRVPKDIKQEKDISDTGIPPPSTITSFDPSASCIVFTAEIQLIWVNNDTSVTKDASFIPLTIVTSLITVDDKHQGAEAYERYVNRLQRDIYRTGRKWRRKIERKSEDPNGNTHTNSTNEDNNN